jgi:hypothetical protein
MRLINDQVADRPRFEEGAKPLGADQRLSHAAYDRCCALVAVGLCDPDAEGGELGEMALDTVGRLIDELDAMCEDECASETLRGALRVEDGGEHLRLTGADRRDEQRTSVAGTPGREDRIARVTLIAA